MRSALAQLARTDAVLVSAALLLTSIGLLALYSFSETVSGNVYFGKQLAVAVVGVGLMFFIGTLDYRHFARMSTLLYFVTIAVLLVVLFLGAEIRGTVGWLALGGFQIQPVEFAKLVLVVFLASFISKKHSELGEWTRLIASLFLSALLILLVLRQPDLGSGLVLAFIWLSMIVVSGIRWKHVFVLGLLGLALLGTSWFFLADYQKARLQTFLDPELDPKGSGYNVLQSMVAVGSGGLSGKGIGHGSQSQLNFLPERHTDFIFAVISEELGLIGGGLILFLYGLLLYRIMRIAQVARDNTGYLIAVGILALFFVHILINLGMNMGFLPVTGLPAPFLSYGGSALLAFFLELGLLLSVYRYREERPDRVVSLEYQGLDL
ncbi:MAG: rod shape-determining protein RodA [Candidatus Moraniibacteriota bacterium]|nr:MAG: rod shape-determining protein RodA [Candidatus Moranbacteria bacterium]